MIKEEEYEMLKTRMVKAYTDYINTAQKTSINDMDDWNKRKGLIETFARSVEANTAYRRFILIINPLSHQKVQNNSQISN